MAECANGRDHRDGRQFLDLIDMMLEAIRVKVTIQDGEVCLDLDDAGGWLPDRSKGGAHEGHQTILLTTDLSEDSKKAVTAALTLAKKFDAKVILAFVGDWFPPIPSSFHRHRRRPGPEEMYERARKDLGEFAKKKLRPGVEVELEVPLGVPHLEIVNSRPDAEGRSHSHGPHGGGSSPTRSSGDHRARARRALPGARCA